MTLSSPHPIPLDLRCYFVTGRGETEHLVRIAAQASLGGCGVVQVRSKPIAPDALYDLAARIGDAVRDDTIVLIDDQVDVAERLIRAGAHVHGVHLGQEDTPVAIARERLGPRAIIGLTTGTAALVEKANAAAEHIDYIGAGPFRPSPTKDSGRAPLGVDGYPPLVAASITPIVAIGDITVRDARALAGTGVAGLALCRGLMSSPDPRRDAARIVAAFRDGEDRR